jgi:two-component system chemotaxis sensor kinase CheA
MEETGIDALVVDYSMPGSDGVELVGRVRSLHVGLPIVMLSGVASPEDQERARSAGVDAYFDKADFREGALANTLRRLVADRPARLEDVR